jgi:choice-of-anchor B domain-containing protein
MKKQLLLFIFSFFFFSLTAQQSLNMNLIGSWENDTLPASSINRYNECWGYVDCQGNEYALLGSAAYLHVIDISQPETPTEIASFPGGDITVWRDMKHYRDRVYSVCDGCSEGLMIVDMSAAPDSVKLSNQTNEFFDNCHNIYIDREAGRLYAVGTNAMSNGIVVLDLTQNPDQPTLISKLPLPGGYIHDLYVEDNIAYCNHGNNGLYVYDYTDAENPEFLGSLTQYPESGYNHSSWLSPDGNHLVFCDETFDRGVKLANVEDFGDIFITDVFRSTLEAPDHTNSIAHNPLIRGQYIFISYYHDGIQIYDYSDPENVERVAYFDTDTLNTNYNGFRGAWGVNPFLPSGLILGSDMNNGLFILELDESLPAMPEEYWPQQPSALLSPEDEASVCEGDSIQLEAVGASDMYAWFRDGMLLNDNTPSIQINTPGSYYAELNDQHCFTQTDSFELEVILYPILELSSMDTTACNGDLINLDLSTDADSIQWQQDDMIIPDFDNFTFGAFESGNYSVIGSNAQCADTSNSIQLTFFDPVDPLINIQDNLLIAEPAGLTYQWFLDGEPIPGATDGQYEVSESGAYSVETIDMNGCTGLSPSVTIVIDNTTNWESEVSIRTGPNPASDVLHIQRQGTDAATPFAFFDSVGRLLNRGEIANTNSSFDLRELPAGIYWLQFTFPEGQIVRKVVKQ